MTAQEAVCVFSPSPYFTVTIEASDGAEPEVHFHAGGQGVWVARMIGVLGGVPVLCAPLGGESGVVLRSLIEHEGISLRAIFSRGASGGYVHDRRAGERKELARVPSAKLSRHEQDELYGTALVAALEARVAVITGPAEEGLIAADLVRRFALDAGANDVAIVADLSGEVLRALEGGVHVLKLAHDELIEAGFARDGSRDELVGGMRAVRERCAANVLLSRAEEPALALFGERLYEVRAPRFEAFDHRGAGDSMTAALAVGVRRGLPVEPMLRLAAAAGALNVTRRGLGSGRRENIEALAAQVEVALVG